MISRFLDSFDTAVADVGRAVDSGLNADSAHISTLRLTLVLLVLHAGTSASLDAALRILCLFMLVFPEAIYQRSLWLALVAALAIGTLDSWYLVDNHQYLILYWVAACALNLNHRRHLSTNARVLIAVAFSFAVAWKIIAGQYFDGGFFYMTAIIDPRLQNVAGVVTAIGTDQLKVTADALRYFVPHGEVGSSINILQDSRLTIAALFMSYAGIGVEAAVATAHWLPGLSAARWRHAILIGFVSMTYFLLPVTGFGFVLAVMGFAQTDNRQQWLKRVYVGLVLLIQATVVPWRNLLTQ
jgi:hypothetical protein